MRRNSSHLFRRSLSNSEKTSHAALQSSLGPLDSTHQRSVPQLRMELLGNGLDFLKDLFRDASHKTVVDLLPNPVSTLINMITTNCSHTLTLASHGAQGHGLSCPLNREIRFWVGSFVVYRGLLCCALPCLQPFQVIKGPALQVAIGTSSLVMEWEEGGIMD